MSQIKLLLLDLDDVLVDYSQPIRCRELAEVAGVNSTTIQRAVFDSGLERRSDSGEFNLDEYMNLLRTEWGLDIPVDDFITARRNSTKIRNSMMAICNQLKTQVQMGILTNNGHWLHQNIDRIVPQLKSLFGTRLVCSGSIGIQKPEPTAYLACLERLGFSASSTLFVDDKLSNVNGAHEAGLDAFVFEHEAQFISELKQRGFQLEN
jgi:HAD superfamily hydrolase (TIGR01509 family)